MCGTCGCGEPGRAAGRPGGDHEHHHPPAERVVAVERDVLEGDARLAARVRGILAAEGICALNLVSSPGSGKTALLEVTLPRLHDRGIRAAVLVGDLATERDAARLRAASSAPAEQITTGEVCHLDAHMILHGLERFDLAALDLLLIENVGNLVCPAAFDLGENGRVVLTSVTEGEDKPLKYPVIYQRADLALITKTDLAPVLGTDVAALRGALADVAPAARVLEVSARDGRGIEAWTDWVENSVRSARAAREAAH